jgi:hypothetical protein
VREGVAGSRFHGRPLLRSWPQLRCGQAVIECRGGCLNPPRPAKIQPRRFPQPQAPKLERRFCVSFGHRRRKTLQEHAFDVGARKKGGDARLWQGGRCSEGPSAASSQRRRTGSSRRWRFLPG